MDCRDSNITVWSQCLSRETDNQQTSIEPIPWSKCTIGASQRNRVLIITPQNWNIVLILHRGSSVSIVSGYGLDDRAIEVRSPTGAKDFSCSLCVQTGSEVHPASCPMGTGGLFPGGKRRPGRHADDSPHLVQRSWMSRNYTSSSPKRLHGV
jgi:hypothetical protein